MNAPAIQSHAALALSMPRAELIRVLGESIYPGAKPQSIEMAIAYCAAAGLDPLQKPVHIVPMWDRNAGGMRDVVMPGVNLYRTQAARSGQFGGMSDAEFGPMVKGRIGGEEIEYPEWARVVVTRILADGTRAEFAAREFWIENYAVKGGKEKSVAPNAMWTRRPRGQIAKCAEAQALRKAFPEFAAAPTAEEMEGKSIDGGPVVDPANTITAPPQELLDRARAAADLGRDGFAAFWKTLTPGEGGERDLLRFEIDALKVRTDEAEKRIAAARADAEAAARETVAATGGTGAPGADPAASATSAPAADSTPSAASKPADDFGAAYGAEEQRLAGGAAPKERGARGGKK